MGFQEAAVRWMKIAPQWLQMVAIFLLAEPSLLAADRQPRAEEYVARLTRINEGFTNLRMEQARLLEREKEAVRELEKSKARLTEASGRAFLIQGQVRTTLQRIEGLRREMNSTDMKQRNDRAIRRQIEDLERSIVNLNNELAVIEVAVEKERMRGNGLANDLETASTSLANIRRSGLAQLNEFYMLADVFGRLSRDEHRAAVAALTDFINADDENVGARLVRGIAQHRLGNAAEAEADISSVTTVEGPLQAVAFMARGELRMAVGKEREGRGDIGRANKLTGKQPDSRVLLHRAWLECCDGKYSTAETSLKKAIRLGGSDIDVERLLALTQISLPASTANAKSALEHAQRACEITKSKDWICLEALAAAHAAAGDFTAAVNVARQSLELATGENRERCAASLQLYEQSQPPQLTWMRLARLEERVARPSPKSK